MQLSSLLPWGLWAEEVSQTALGAGSGGVWVWLCHPDTLVWANPCLRLPMGLGRAQGAGGSDAAGHPLPVHAHLNLHVFPRTLVCVHSGPGACTRNTRVPGSPRALPRALAPARCSRMHIGCARAAWGRSLEHALGWLVLLHDPPGDVGWWQCPPVFGDQGGHHGLAVGWWVPQGLGAFEKVAVA